MYDEGAGLGNKRTEPPDRIRGQGWVGPSEVTVDGGSASGPEEEGDTEGP